MPLDWKHPKDERGEYIPLQRRDLSYTEGEIEEGLAEGWLKSRQEAEDMLMPDFSNIPEDQMGICAYESVTEGTPISPVFPNTPTDRFELAQYCSENATVFGYQKAPDIEAWCRILFDSVNALFNPKEGTIEFPLPPQNKHLD